MLQDKNRTIRKENNTGITYYRRTYGVNIERKAEIYRSYGQEIP